MGLGINNEQYALEWITTVLQCKIRKKGVRIKQKIVYLYLNEK